MRIRTFKYVDHYSPSDFKTGGIHPSFEILYLAEGSYQMQWLGETYHIKPNSLFFITPNTPHDVIILSSKATFWYIELDEAFTTSLFPSLENILVWNRLQCESDISSHMPDVMTHTIMGINDLLRHDIKNMTCGSDLLMLDISKLFIIVNELLQSHKQGVDFQDILKQPLSQTPTQDIIKTLMINMESTFRDDITLGYLSSLSHFQNSYLIKKFKEYSGFTPMSYLNELRMRAAANYLTTTTLKINQIAEECGYPNIHHFSSAFKKHTGKSPTDWRNQFSTVKSEAHALTSKEK
ncbi:helix-turn-helix domain-containing protein [Paenibacillus agaridevorans]|uniref:helix-turn-helix domain-containing protein n=1 Tax=Paenibacillus agaridevorans TaxID=171404 RepID=UPI001BE3D068|nr:AraC family transcriptional regulator [Paenibacillus agaridevorans]